MNTRPIAALTAALALVPVLALALPFWGAKVSSPAQTPPKALQPGEFVWLPQAAPAGPIVVVVGLDDQLAYAYRNGVRIGYAKVSTGKKGHETPTGVFTTLQKDKDHHSSIYNNAAMPYTQRLTWGGVALHAGGIPDYPSSHGCVHLPSEFARLLFEVSPMGMTVVVGDGGGAGRRSRIRRPRAGRCRDRAGQRRAAPGRTKASAGSPTSRRRAGLVVLSARRPARDRAAQRRRDRARQDPGERPAQAVRRACIHRRPGAGRATACWWRACRPGTGSPSAAGLRRRRGDGPGRGATAVASQCRRRSRRTSTRCWCRAPRWCVVDERCRRRTAAGHDGARQRRAAQRGALTVASPRPWRGVARR